MSLSWDLAFRMTQRWQGEQVKPGVCVLWPGHWTYSPFTPIPPAKGWVQIHPLGSALLAVSLSLLLDRYPKSCDESRVVALDILALKRIWEHIGAQ